MSLANNIAQQIQVIYSVNSAEEAHLKTLLLIQKEITHVMDATYVAVFRDVKDSIRASLSTLDKSFREREKEST